MFFTLLRIAQFLMKLFVYVSYAAGCFYVMIEKKKAAPQPWQTIAQRFCSLGIYRSVTVLIKEIIHDTISEKSEIER